MDKMDDFRAIVKTFEMLDDHARNETSRSACLNLARVTIDADVQRKIREFVDDHLLPARFENVGRELGKRQERLFQSLRSILGKAGRNEDVDDAATIPIDPRLSDDTARWSDPAMSGFAAATDTLSTPATVSTNSPNNIFRSYSAASTPRINYYPSPPTLGGTSQLEQIYAWGGADSVRDLLDLNNTTKPTDKRRQKQTGEEKACKERGEQYGGVRTAPEWAGKGAPMREYGDAGR